MFIRYKDYFGKGTGDLIDWDIQNMTGYTPETTYYTDFSIADHFGLNAIKDTLKRAKEQCETFGYVWKTELSMVLNWKIFEHYGKNEEYAEFYDEAWREYAGYLQDTLQGDELSYYYKTTD